MIETTYTYREAINEALIQEMQADERVFVYGIDVGDHKQTYGTTRRIKDTFGEDRCFATPLSEEALLGFGLGAALMGLRPVNIHIRVDFLLLAMNQLVNMVSSYRYGTNGKVAVPLVIRAVIGKGWGQAWQHSKSMQSWFAHIPGLQVVMPTTPSDAKWLLVHAIRNENPVIVLEHRLLYDVTGPVLDFCDASCLETAQVLREGSDVTIVADSYMNVHALHASDLLLRHHNVRAEVIDVRSAAPVDMHTILASAQKTERCVVLDNDWTFCGLSAEIAAQAMHDLFSTLKVPVERVGFVHVPCPCTRPLEDLFYPNASHVVRVVERMMDLPEADLSEEKFFTYENKFTGPF